MKKLGKLFLIPTPLGENSIFTLPEYLITTLHGLEFFIAEKARTARRFIKETGYTKSIQNLEFFELNKYTGESEWKGFLIPAENGHDIGLLSEAGNPAIADPGAKIVALAHKKGIEVVPLVGPSSILLALIASGMNGQSFCFHGYLSPKKNELAKDLKRLEQFSKKYRQTQIFMETPYRNSSILETALKALSPHTKFCIAVDITLSSQLILTKTIGEWKKGNLPDLHKRLAVFLIYS